MIKTIKFNKKIILVIIISLLLGYYIYYKNNNDYEEFEEISNDQELTVSEEKIDDKFVYTQGGDVALEEDTPEDNTEEETGKQEKTERMIVHITGEVINWGVIELEPGARVIDAVNKAGGFTEQADTTKVNLAYELSDGVKIYIPSKTEEASNQVEYITENSGDNVIMGESEMKETKTLLVNINNATQTELETLPGIGPSIALKIISYRQENGSFQSIEDIKNVSGIGENKFENIRQLICI